MKQSMVQPTAQALPADAAATADSAPGPGLGLATRCHDVPFQCRISVWGRAEALVAVARAATAQALRADVAATPNSAPPGAGGRAGHLLPGLAVPVRDQGLQGLAVVAADRPGVAGRGRGHGVVRPAAARRGTGHLRPGRAVPAQDDRLAGEGLTDRPGVAGRRGGHAEQRARLRHRTAGHGRRDAGPAGRCVAGRQVRGPGRDHPGQEQRNPQDLNRSRDKRRRGHSCHLPPEKNNGAQLIADHPRGAA